jgi:hypothetical protein
MTGGDREIVVAALERLSKGAERLRKSLASTPWTGVTLPAVTPVSYTLAATDVDAAEATAEAESRACPGWWRLSSGHGSRWKDSGETAGHGDGALLAGEWLLPDGDSLHIGPAAAAGQRRRRVFRVTPGLEGAGMPALAEEVLTLAEGGAQPDQQGDSCALVHQVLWGFRDAAAARNGELVRLACRFAGFASRGLVVRARLGDA